MSEQQSVTNLVERLGGWLEQQPEYPYLFLADRATRRRAARLVAYRMMVLPKVPANARANRAEARKQRKAVHGMVGKMQTQLSKKRERLLRKAEKDRARYARLSLRRMMDLAVAGDETAGRIMADPNYEGDRA